MPFFDKRCLVLVPILIGQLSLQWYAHGNGLLRTPDSFHYIAASESLTQTMTLIDNDGHHFLFWPPLFPVIISLTGAWLSWINLIVAAAITVCIFSFIKSIIKNKWIGFFALTFVSLGVHTLLISTFLWSELIFLCFTALFLSSLLQSGERKSAFYLAIVMGFLMCLQRNAGLFIATGAAIWMLLNEQDGRWKFVKSILFFFCVISGSMVWNVYVWFHIPHRHFDFSGKFFQHAFQNLNSLFYAITDSFMPMSINPLIIIPVLVCGTLVVLYFLKMELVKNKSLQLFSLVSGIYLFFLILVLTVNPAGFVIDAGEADRFISVIVPFLSILVFKSIDSGIDRLSEAVRVMTVVLIGLWLVYPIARTVKNAKQWHAISTSGISTLNSSDDNGEE